MADATVDRRGLELTLGRLDRNITDMTPIWKSCHAYQTGVTVMQFDALRKGGRSRGVSWKYFAIQYKRKTDRRVIPAWGGVPRRIARKTKSMSLGRWFGSQRPNYMRTAKERKRVKGMVLGRVRTGNGASRTNRVQKGDSIMQNTGLLMGGVLSKIQAWRTGNTFYLEMDTPGDPKVIGHLHKMRPWQFFTRKDKTQHQIFIREGVTRGLV